MPAEEKFSEEIRDAEDGLEIDLVDLMLRMLEKWYWIAGAAVLCAVAMGLYSYLMVEPTYRSTAKLYVVSTNDSAINLTDLNLGDKVADDFVQVFKNRDVYDQVVIRMQDEYDVELPYTFERMQKMMTISVISNTRILQITVDAATSEEAQQITTAYAETAKDFIAAVMGLREPTDFELARPGKLNDPNLIRNAVLGFMMGAIAVMAVIVVMYIVDDRIRTPDQLQKRLGLATLGMMPVLENERKIYMKRYRG